MPEADEVQWVIRQTGFGQRSWAYDPSMVHRRRSIEDPEDSWKTVCGIRVPMGLRLVTPTPQDARCKRCFR